MKKELASAVVASIDALLQVPGTQLQHILPTLKQLLIDLEVAGITPPCEIDDLIDRASIDPEDDDYAWEKYEERLLERMHTNSDLFL